MPKFVKKEARPVVEAIQIETDFTYLLKAGDWIVREQDGRVTVMGNNSFERSYEEIK